ncbi:DeoR/GlpR family DNA-binding transcription regulator [Vibrio inusitatus]|nr:DeoR/GlpR family DNA-binding transcription regulator [Vibrio inusitatus]
MQNLSLRQRQMIEMISSEEYCGVEALSEHFSVTTQTIRRDINELCALGYAQRHHGGVGLPVTLANRSYMSRVSTNKDEKRAIAREVVQRIPDGSTVFLGIGTTIAAIAEQLLNHNQLRVVTNNFQAAHILSQYDHIETWMPGGRLRSTDGDVVGEDVSRFFEQFVADIGIVSCASVSRVRALSGTNSTNESDIAMEHELREALVSQAILANAQQRWLVANSSKWHRKATARVAEFHYFDHVFGDRTQSESS